MNRLLDHKEMLLIQMDLKGYLLHRRSLHLVPLLILGVFLMAWVYPVASPIAPVILVVVAALESQFNNILYRTSNELEGMSLFPIAWDRIIFAKNVSTILLLCGLIVLTSMALLYFSPDTMTLERWGKGWAYVATIIFPLLHFGNTQSVRRPRRVTGLQVNDFVETLWFMVNLALVSIPYYLFVEVFHLGTLCVFYSSLAAWYWYRHSVRATAHHLEKEIAALCSKR